MPLGFEICMFPISPFHTEKLARSRKPSPCDDAKLAQNISVLNEAFPRTPKAQTPAISTPMLRFGIVFSDGW